MYLTLTFSQISFVIVRLTFYDRSRMLQGRQTQIGQWVSSAQGKDGPLAGQRMIDARSSQSQSCLSPTLFVLIVKKS